MGAVRTLLLLLFSVLCVAKLKTSWRELEGYTFQEYLSEFSKQYGEPEAQRRKSIFEVNLAKILKHNMEEHSWKMGLNQFTDMTQVEQQKFRGFNKVASLAYRREHPEKFPITPVVTDITSLPASVDWRQKQVVTAVKDQGMCGSCWAFASTETIESHVALATGQLMVLSPQQLVSCSPNPNHCGGTGGCGGSVPELAFDFVTSNGMATEWTYSYTSGVTGQNGNCTKGRPVVTVKGYEKLPNNSYSDVMDAVANKGPLSINVQANVWGSYEEGVFTGCDNYTNIDIDHVVQLVGYGTDAQHGDYWWVRNSWNTVWGEAGYIRLARSSQPVCGIDPTPQDGTGCAGDNKPQHVCGECAILFDVSYPTGAGLK